MRNPFRRRWIAVIVGNESGIIYPVDFLLFHQESKGRTWVDERNAQKHKSRTAINELTHWELHQR